MAKQDRSQQHQIRERPERRAADKPATQVASRPVPRAERTIETQAKSLGDRRASSAQRQAMALHMGRTQGNRHVQRVVSSMQSRRSTAAGTTTNRTANERTADQVPEGMGSSGTPSMAGAWPPEQPSLRHLHRMPESPPAVVQCDLVDDARTAARGLLNRLTGQADEEGRQIEGKSSAGVTEVDRDSRTRGIQFQSKSQSQSTQIETLAAREQSTLERQANAQSAQIETQESAAEATLQSQWSGLESKVTSSEIVLENKTTGRTIELTDQAQGISNQVTERWNTREGETTSEMSTLERVVRSLYGTTQARARQLLNSEQEQDVDSAAQSIEGGWLALLSRIAPFQRRLSQVWDTLSRWFRGLLQPLGQRLRQFSQWVTRQVAALARHIRALWSRVAQITRRIHETIQNLASRARQLLGRVVSATIGRVRSGAQRILGAARQSAVRLGRFVRRTAQRLVRRLQQHTQRAIGRVQEGISRLARFFARAAGRVLSGLRSVAGPALSRLRASAGIAVTWARDLGRIALDGLRAVGSRIASAVRAAGTQALGMVATIGRTALQSLGVAWRGVQRAWQGLQGRLSGFFDRLRDRASSLADTIRDRLLRPMWDGIRSRWQALRENVRFGLGRLIRGWRRLVAWGRSARARARSEDPQVQDAVLGEARQRAEAPFESVFYKRQPGASSRGVGHAHVPARFHADAGQPLDSGVRSRMESAFGHSFGNVRMHSGADAARATRQSGARALTMGTEVAFAQGEYQPGTPIGDALIAHELAHVIQQDGTDMAQRTPAQEDEIETDADRSAIGAVAALWTGAKDAAGRIAQNALPRLRSGLRLSSCRREFPEGVPKPRVTFSPIHVGPKLPNDVYRIPPGEGTSVSVQIDGWQDIMPPIVISVISDRGGRNTPILVNGEQETEIEANGTQSVTVSGKQPLTSQAFKLVARCGGALLKEGDSFYIAAHPSGVTFSFQEVMRGKAHEGKQYWGAIYGLTIDSDSGNREDLGLVEATEIIQKDNPTGFFAQIPLQRSGFRPALSPHPDHHGVSFGSSAAFKSIIDTDAGATGTQVQYLRFAGGGAAIERNYHNGPIIPNSGFKISLKVTKEKGRYYLHVSKQGFANNGASAGTVTGEASQPIEVE